MQSFHIIGMVNKSKCRIWSKYIKKVFKKDIKIYETRKDKCLFSSLHNIYINNCKVKGRRVNIEGIIQQQ